MVRPLHNRIIFAFLDQVSNGMFEDHTVSGIYLGGIKDLTSKSPRWGVVLTIGPEIKDPEIVPGALIMIDALRWTDGVVYNDVKIWMTTEKDVVLISSDHNAQAEKTFAASSAIIKKLF